jgi:1-acyl-sn-glycerol-3-phosphate acyltransferase
MKKAIDIVLGGIYILYFGILLCVFHVVQFIAFEFFGPRIHQKMVELLNFFIVKGWIITGSTSSFKMSEPLPTNQTMIFVANHQSMFDICGIVWYMRNFTPLFISKKELSKGIPSISYNLRVGNAALIDRKDPKQAIGEIIKFANFIKKNNFSGVIFPEGTRSRTGHLKPFATGGVSALLKKCPEAMVVPIAIWGTGKFNPSGIFPLTSFTKMTWATLRPIDPKGKSAEEVCMEVENQISGYLKKFL